MRYGRTLVAGLGWAGPLGGLALCVLIFLSGSLAFDHHGAGGKPREGEIILLHAVPEAEVQRVRLGRPRQAGASPSAAGTSRPPGSVRPQAPPPTPGETTRDTLTPPALPAP